ncbi:MAG: trigger factor [Candidatus Binataceae bacterium]
MNVNIENTSELGRKVTIELEPAEINRELDRTYNELKRSVQLKGFRPGHVPRNLLERFFGDQIRGDVIQKLIKEYTGKALEENDLKPVVEPEIVTEETDLKKAFRFSAMFDLKPALVVKDYQDLKIPTAEVTLNESDVDAELERIRQRSATLKKVEGRTLVQEGDFVLAAIEGFEHDKAIDGTKVDDRLLRVSKDALAHGLDEVLLGAEVSQETRKSRSYPADYTEKEIAGKDVEWRASVKELYTTVVPELDDEFAKDQGEFQSLTDLRDAVRKQLQERARQEADARARQGLIDLIIERNPIELPDSLVVREQRAIESELAAGLQAAGMTQEEAVAKAHENAEETRTRAEKRARTGLIIDAIAEQENVDVNDDQVAERVAQIVLQGGRQRERVAEYYKSEEARATLQQTMRREKTLDALMTRAQIESETSAGESPASA